MTQIRYAHNGGVRIAYESFGPEDGEPLVLVMGLDFQMVWWPDGLCEALIDQGFRLIRFDNRDAGLSTHFTSHRAQGALAALTGRRRPAYTTADMVDDILSVMDAEGLASAHLLGASMGAALVQRLAAQHPSRVRSLVSAMGLPADAAGVQMLRYLQFGMLRRMGGPSRLRSDDDEIQRLVDTARLIASPGYPFDEQWARHVAQTSHARSPRDPTASQRQMAAARVAPPRLADIVAPTLVISGLDDPIISPRGGLDTADRIARATFLGYQGMGHHFPGELWGPIALSVAANAARR